MAGVVLGVGGLHGCPDGLDGGAVCLGRIGHIALVLERCWCTCCMIWGGFSDSLLRNVLRLHITVMKFVCVVVGLAGQGHPVGRPQHGSQAPFCSQEREHLHQAVGQGTVLFSSVPVALACMHVCCDLKQRLTLLLERLIISPFPCMILIVHEFIVVFPQAHAEYC